MQARENGARDLRLPRRARQAGRRAGCAGRRTRLRAADLSRTGGSGGRVTAADLCTAPRHSPQAPKERRSRARLQAPVPHGSRARAPDRRRRRAPPASCRRPPRRRRAPARAQQRCLRASSVRMRRQRPLRRLAKDPSNEGRRSPQTRLASGLAATIVVTSGPVSKVQIPVGGASSKDASTPIEITYRRTSAREGQDGDRQGNRGPGTH